MGDAGCTFGKRVAVTKEKSDDQCSAERRTNILGFRMGITCLPTLRLLIVLLVFALPASAQQDPPNRNCCFHIYSTGIELGLLHSTAKFEGRWRLYAIQQLFRAGNNISIANAICSETSPAWLGWKARLSELRRLGELIAGGRVDQDDVVSFAERTVRQWGDGLKQLGVRSSRNEQEDWFRDETCAESYFTIGHNIGFAHAAFQLAADPAAARTTARRDGLTAINAALESVYRLRDTRPWSGYCVPIWDPEVRPPVLRLLQDMVLGRQRLDSPALRDMTWDVRRTIATLFNVDIQPDVRVPPNFPFCPGTPLFTSERAQALAQGAPPQPVEVWEEFARKVGTTLTGPVLADDTPGVGTPDVGTPAPGAPGAVTPAGIEGLWSRPGGVTAQISSGGVGKYVELGDLAGHGFRKGEEAIRVQPSGPNTYKGKLLWRWPGGGSEWRDYELTVRGNTMVDSYGTTWTRELAAPASPDAPPEGGDVQRFVEPMWQGERLDGCKYFGRQCEEPAATEFCRRNGYEKAVSWEMSGMIERTNIITGGTCKSAMPSFPCGGFNYIDCKK